MTRRAIYAGSFDPLTLGHVNIIERGLDLFDELLIALAINVQKTPLFTLDERVELISQTFPDRAIEVVTFDGLLVDLAKQRDCSVILRGLRNTKDFEYELTMATMNEKLAPQIETIFLMTHEDHFYVSSSLVKEVARFGGDISRFVPPHIAPRLLAKFGHT